MLSFDLSALCNRTRTVLRFGVSDGANIREDLLHILFIAIPYLRLKRLAGLLRSTP